MGENLFQPSGLTRISEKGRQPLTVRLRIDPGYQRGRRRLDAQDRNRADLALERFVVNPLNPILRFEALKGGLAGYHSIRASYSVRILLRREVDETGELFAAVDVGNHDAVYRRR